MKAHFGYPGSDVQESFSDGFSSSTFGSDEIPIPTQCHVDFVQEVLPITTELPRAARNRVCPVPPLAEVAQTHQYRCPKGVVPDDPSTNLRNNNTKVPSPNVDRLDWDVFRLLPPKPDRRGKGVFYDFCLQILKLATFFVLFALTLFSSVLAKSVFFLMASGIGQAGQNVSICPDKIPEASENAVFISTRNAAKWVWAVLLALCGPELICFIQCFHRSMFRTVKRPMTIEFLLVFLIESLCAFGTGALAFDVMPQLSVLTAVMFGHALCFVPAVLTGLSRHSSRWLLFFLILDLGAILAQSSVFWLWPGVTSEPKDKAFFMGLCALMISFSWWQNFVHPQSFFGPIRWIASFAARLRERRSKTYAIVSLWKCVIYMFCMFYFLSPRIPPNSLLRSDVFDEQLITITANGLNKTQIDMFRERMQDFERLNFKIPVPVKKTNEKKNKVVEKINIDELPEAEGSKEMSGEMGEKKGKRKNSSTTIKKVNSSDLVKRAAAISNNNDKDNDEEAEEEESVAAYNIYEDYLELNQFTTPYDALWLAIFQIICATVCHHCCKFACKVMMQCLGFALPMAVSGPFTVALLSNVCAARRNDPCYLTSVLNKELFWQCPLKATFPYLSSAEFWSDPQTLLWIMWMISQFWITLHLWTPKHERLADSEKLFVLSYFNGMFVDQSLVLSRRRDDKVKILYEDLDMDAENVDNESNREYQQQARGPPSLCSVSSSKIDSGLIRDTPSSTDTISKIYVCATMWHESAIEQFNLLKSLFRLDEDQSARKNAQKYLKVVDPDYYEFESHIFFDDAFDTDESGKCVINKFVRQLIEKVDEAASAVHQTRIKLKTPKKCSTPFGGCLSYIMPGKNRLNIHLKNKNKIRPRKRWSQVMYLYYLLGYRLMLKVADKARRELLAENTYILTLDGDVDFQPECVHLLVDLMKKNRRLGAACGRIHPRGSGIMIWYQKFEYAVGHWLQKATEHMIGCVLCSPGCFSLFRSFALMDDDVARRYATKSDKPLHYVQYDQGEDRWLCTLLLQRGYRVEYCAASDALTFAPEGFTEFFNQRRRWIPSTLANIIDLLRDYRNVVNVNESISIWYIMYQFIMLTSSILGPGTIFLMIIGAISISFNIDTRLALIIVTAPVLCFCICCLTCKSDKQLLIAQIIGALFAMLMTAVVVGTSLQIQKDGILSPHSVFLFTVLGSLTVAAVLHPLEFTCSIPFVLYFLAIPCMYMLLPIYSLANLNVVSWGTREDPSPVTGGMEKKRSTFVEGNGKETIDGEVSVGCGSFCRLVCCVRPKPVENNPWHIGEGLREIARKLETLESKANGSAHKSGTEEGGLQTSAERRQGGFCKEDIVHEVHELNEMNNNHLRLENNNDDEEGERMCDSDRNSESWLNDKLLRGFERYYLDAEEENFWTDLIERYLQPIAVDSKEQERVQRGLTELRNKTCSAFFMINAVFIIVVLVLQMQKDCLHIEWPFGPKVNHTLVPCHSEDAQEVWVMSRLQLEPISLVFLMFFMSILIIQFLAMLMHRFGTLTHIIASTDLFCLRKRTDKLSEDDLVVQNAVEIARELQAIRGVDRFPIQQNGSDKSEVKDKRHAARHQQTEEHPHGRRPVETLDAAFKKRFFSLSSASMHEVEATDAYFAKQGKLTLNRNTIRALEQRRDSIYRAESGTIDKKNKVHRNQKHYNIMASSDSEDRSLEGAERRRATSPTPPNSSYFHRPRQQFRLDEIFHRNG